MSDGDVPPGFTSNHIETPLDLTTRRIDMDENITRNYDYSRGRPNGRSGSLPLHDQFHIFSQYRQASSYGGEHDQYLENTFHSMTPPPHSSCQSSLSPPSPQSISHMPCPSPTSTSGSSYYGIDYDQPMVPESPSFESGILPKKRKNLWRPYDSKNAIAGGCSSVDVEKDSESSSDSNSGSSSDQEFKTPSPPIDPVKKRKMNMLQYAAEEARKNAERELSLFQMPPSVHSTSHVETIEQQSVSRPIRDQWDSNNLSSSNEPTRDYMRPMAEELTKSQLSLLTNYPDTRDKMISGMKKRDIFGWSLKLMKPSVELEQKSTGSSQTERDDNRFYQDGEKTYIELQTVKKNSTNDQRTKNEVVNISKVESPPKKATKANQKQAVVSPGKRQTSNKNTNTKIKSNDNESEKENINEKRVSKQVYIQRRDNIIESYDETQNVPRTETKKSLSLIDLIEEIEADAITKDTKEIEKTNNRNKSIRALLEQCNHVKLQALDFLMGNILIQDREPHFKQRNETVQKMLKGDKIGSVSMLDVVELQVEIGLN